MTDSNLIDTKPPEATVDFTRMLEAPRALVWQAWTDPRHLAKWWGPHGFTNPVCQLDVRVGGSIRIHMRGPDGAVYPMSGTFEEIVKQERLVFTAVAEDEAGHPLLRAHTTVTFEAQGARTKLTLHAHGVGIAPVAAQMLAGMQQGWSQSLERLSDLVAEPAREKRG